MKISPAAFARLPICPQSLARTPLLCAAVCLQPQKNQPALAAHPLPLAQLLPTALNLYGLTPLLLSTPRLHTRFLLQVDYSNSK